ncbi:MAG: hypothetical protein JW837_16340 [Sedimentisphaerales bacterium]|nr:hypothetical protein [Sedimentisphaerales bacterium]
MKKKTVKKLTIFAIIIVLLGLSYAIAVSYSSAKLSQAYKDLNKDGRPMEPGQVIPPEVSDSQNAALLYECAALFLRAQPAPDGNLLQYLGALSDKLIKKDTIDSDELTELEQLIKQEQVTLALSIVKQGTQRDWSRFDLNYDDGLGIPLPHLHGLRNLIFIGCAKAQIEAKTGNPDKAWDMIATQLKFTDALWTEPILISQLVRMASIRLTCRTIRKLCEIAPPNEQQYTDIQNLLKDLDDIRPLITAIDGDRLLSGEWVFKLSKRELLLQNDLFSLFSEDWSYNTLGRIHTFFKPTFIADHAAYLRLMQECVRVAEQPYSQERLEYLKEKVQKKRYTIRKELTIPIWRVKEIYCSMIAELHITQTGLALLQYKQKEGTFPDSLEKLNFKNINDPFSDKSLIYKSEGPNFTLYSIGPDQKDNNGSPKKDKQETDFDIVWNFTPAH